jgi:hypothetical protein
MARCKKMENKETIKTALKKCLNKLIENMTDPIEKENWEKKNHDVMLEWAYNEKIDIENETPSKILAKYSKYLDKLTEKTSDKKIMVNIHYDVYDMLPKDDEKNNRLINDAIRMYFKMAEGRKKGGSSKSEEKANSARRNGKFGGRPRKETVITLWKDGVETEIMPKDATSEDFIV